MAIAIADDETLGRLMRTVIHEIIDAEIFWRLHREVQIAAGTFRREVAQSRTFWSLTQQALLDAVMFRLCKIYDQHRDALHLKSLLETIRAHRYRFGPARFRERMKDNPHLEFLMQGARALDDQQLQRDLDYVSASTNPTVETLVGLRHKFYAHRASREVVNATDLSQEYPLTKAQVTELLARARELVNRYIQQFDANVYSAQIVGHDDYRTVIEAVHWDLERRRTETHRQSVRVDLRAAWEEVVRRTREDEAPPVRSERSQP